MYTPGPWTIEKDNVSNAFWIYSPISRDICDLYARVQDKCERYENAEANAALIAAAPELLEACKKAEQMLSFYHQFIIDNAKDGVYMVGKTITQIEAAIRKAEGKV